MAIILMYHRIGDHSDDPWLMSVTPKCFEEQLRIIVDHFKPISLREVDGESPVSGNAEDFIRSVAVTFDDGYADNFYEALPVLERLAVPATFFLATGYINTARLYWWDELSRLLLKPEKLPRVLALATDAGSFRWDLGSDAFFDIEARARSQRWCAWDPPPTARHDLYCQLWQLMYTAQSSVRQQILNQLQNWAELDPETNGEFRLLTASEATALGRHPMTTIGAHSVSHSRMSSLSVTEQYEEIHGSKSALQALTGTEITAFAYPFGKRADYTADTLDLVGSAGFLNACTNEKGVVERYGASLELPRMHVQSWDAAEFYKRLEGWM